MKYLPGLVSLHLEVVTADSPQIINNNPVEIWARPFAGQQRRPAVQDLGGFSYEKYLIVFNCGQFGINSDKWICPAIMSPALRPTLAEHFNKEEIFGVLNEETETIIISSLRIKYIKHNHGHWEMIINIYRWLDWSLDTDDKSHYKHWPGP